MLNNPFIVSGNIPDHLFCDRVAESDKLIKWLTNNNNVVLISPRRMGKTGLIRHCFNQKDIADNYNTIFIDILQTTSLQEFTFLLGKQVYESLLPKNKKLITGFIQALKSLSGKFSFDPVSNLPSFSVQLGDMAHPEFTLQEIFEFLESTPLPNIVAIDEFQQISNYPEKNIEAILRTHIQKMNNCNFIFSGSQFHLMQAMFLYPSRPFYHSSSIMTLEAIPRDVYSDFACKLFKDYNKNIEPETIDFLYHEFDGYTFYLQKVLNEAFTNTDISELCSIDDIRKAIYQCIEANSVLFREQLSTIPVRQKELLLSIAKEGYAKQITSSDFIRKHGLKSASSVQSAVKKLIEMNLVTKIEGTYSLSDKFLRIWLNKTY